MATSSAADIDMLKKKMQAMEEELKKKDKEMKKELKKKDDEMKKEMKKKDDEMKKEMKKKDDEMKKKDDEIKKEMEDLMVKRLAQLQLGSYSLGDAKLPGSSEKLVRDALQARNAYLAKLEEKERLILKKIKFGGSLPAEDASHLEEVEKELIELLPDYETAEKFWRRPSSIGRYKEIRHDFIAKNFLKIPASLFCNVFCLDSLQRKAEEEEIELRKQASNIISHSNAIIREFINGEKKMNEAVAELLSLSGYTFSAHAFDGCSTDSCFFDPMSANRLYVVQEGKLPNGTGDPAVQGAGYYVLARHEHHKSLKRRRQKLSAIDKLCPAFILANHGELFDVYGVVTLTPEMRIMADAGPAAGIAFSLVKQFSIGQPGAAIKLVSWLRVAIRELRSYTDEATTGQLCNHFPVVKTDFSLRFLRHLRDNLFLAKIDNDDDDDNNGEECFVKFLTGDYGQAAHDYCHGSKPMSFAPEILHYEVIPSYAGPIIMVVMKKDDSFTTLHEALKKENLKSPQKVVENLTSAVEFLHEEDFVHGDIRPPNVLVNDKGEIKLIDFDWAGRAGCAIYPSLLNGNVGWPEGATAGEEITKEHDTFMLQKIVKKIQAINQ